MELLHLSLVHLDVLFYLVVLVDEGVQGLLGRPFYFVHTERTQAKSLHYPLNLSLQYLWLWSRVYDEHHLLVELVQAFELEVGEGSGTRVAPGNPENGAVEFDLALAFDDADHVGNAGKWEIVFVGDVVFEVLFTFPPDGGVAEKLLNGFEAGNFFQNSFFIDGEFLESGGDVVVAGVLFKHRLLVQVD